MKKLSRKWKIGLATASLAVISVGIVAPTVACTVSHHDNAQTLAKSTVSLVKQTDRVTSQPLSTQNGALKSENSNPQIQSSQTPVTPAITKSTVAKPTLASPATEPVKVGATGNANPVAPANPTPTTTKTTTKTTSWWDHIKQEFEHGWNDTKNAFEKFGDDTKNAFDNLGHDIKSWWGSVEHDATNDYDIVVEHIKAWYEDMVNGLKTGDNDVKTFFENVWSDIINGVKKVNGDIASGITGWFNKKDFSVAKDGAIVQALPYLLGMIGQAEAESTAKGKPVAEQIFDYETMVKLFITTFVDSAIGGQILTDVVGAKIDSFISEHYEALNRLGAWLNASGILFDENTGTVEIPVKIGLGETAATSYIDINGFTATPGDGTSPL